MDWWVDEKWLDGRMFEWMKGWVDGRIERLSDGEINRMMKE